MFCINNIISMYLGFIYFMAFPISDAYMRGVQAEVRNEVSGPSI